MIVVTAREKTRKRAGQRKTLCAKFSKDFLLGIVLADQEYVVVMVSEIGFVVMAETKNVSVYFRNPDLVISEHDRAMLDSHLKYYQR